MIIPQEIYVPLLALELNKKLSLDKNLAKSPDFIKEKAALEVEYQPMIGLDPTDMYGQVATKLVTGLRTFNALLNEHSPGDCNLDITREITKLRLEYYNRITVANRG